MHYLHEKSSNFYLYQFIIIEIKNRIKLSANKLTSLLNIKIFIYGKNKKS